MVGFSDGAYSMVKKKKCHFTYERRKSLVKAIRYVDLALPEVCWRQKVNNIKRYRIDCQLMGDGRAGKFDLMREFCEVVLCGAEA